MRVQQVREPAGGRLEAWALCDSERTGEGGRRKTPAGRLPGQVWSISSGGQDEGSGLDRIEVAEGPGSGVRILDQPATSTLIPQR